ncbi:hypothetical protein D0T60_15495 [Bacteroides sp. 224]|nr:hypothetical protein [Bacteroides sp. 224]
MTEIRKPRERTENKKDRIFFLELIYFDLQKKSKRIYYVLYGDTFKVILSNTKKKFDKIKT